MNKRVVVTNCRSVLLVLIDRNHVVIKGPGLIHLVVVLVDMLKWYLVVLDMMNWVL